MKSKIKSEGLKPFDIMIEIKETLILWFKSFLVPREFQWTKAFPPFWNSHCISI